MSESLHAQLEVQDVVPQKKTTFEDIPIETLFIIAQDEVLQPQDHYNLALISKTLNLICLPLYFKAYGMEYPHFRVDIHGGDMNEALMKGRRVMAGLYAAVYLRPIPLLVFILRLDPDFRPSYRKLTFERLRKRLASATHLIRAIHSLDKVLITGDNGLLQYTDQGPLSDSLLQERAIVIGDFMNALLEKGCSSLYISHVQLIFESYKFHQTKTIKIKHCVESFFQQTFPSILSNSNVSEDSLNGLRGNGWEFRRPGKKGYRKNITMKVTNAVLPSTGLVSFHIHSAEFLLPPHLSWTLGILRSSPNLTVLSLAHLTLGKSNEYESVITLIQQSVSPSLRELTFRDFGFNMINFNAIMQLLAKLENLEHLKLGRSCDRFIPAPVPSNANTALLPNLQSLSAPIGTSNYLLHARAWEHNRRISTWRTFYSLDGRFHWDEEGPDMHHFDPLFGDLLRVLRHRERSLKEPLKIIVKLVTMHGHRGRERNPHVLQTVKPLNGVKCIVVVDGMLDYTVDEVYFPLGNFVSTIFPDAVQVENEFVRPEFVRALSNGKVPPQLQSFLKWLAASWPSVKRMVCGSWVLNNISEGQDKILITAKVKEVY